MGFYWSYQEDSRIFKNLHYMTKIAKFLDKPESFLTQPPLIQIDKLYTFGVKLCVNVFFENCLKHQDGKENNFANS